MTGPVLDPARPSAHLGTRFPRLRPLARAAVPCPNPALQAARPFRAMPAPSVPSAAPADARDISHTPQHREKLARMAAEIADFFKSYPKDEAVAAIAEHINQFWSRRMRADVIATFQSEPDRLAPLVRLALARVKPVNGS